jgi:transcriptional regulator with PAS, ATPase and Fis domain
LRRAQEASSPLDRFVREVDTYEQPIPLAAMLDLLSHDWPGNVRELERYVAAVEALNDETGPFLAPPLSPPTSTKPAAPAPPTTGTESTRDEQRRPNASELARLFDEHDFVVLRVAEALGVSRPTVKRWAKELSINLPEDLSPEAIEDARGGAAGDLVEMARALRVSVRGLKRRMKELG